MKVLWLSPTLNHYKARFLEKLQTNFPIDITVLAGTGRENAGDAKVSGNSKLEIVQLNVPKSKFGFDSRVRKFVSEKASNYDWIMIPKENKNLLLFLYILMLKSKGSNRFKTFSYNHPIVTSGPNKSGIVETASATFFYRKLDRVVFYTEKSCQRMVELGFIQKQKAFWANNTIDTELISRNYSFCLPNPEKPNILFIGRLTKRKRVDLLLSYYQKLKLSSSKLGGLTLTIIGDGPEAPLVKTAITKDNSIVWTGLLTDEHSIASYMQNASLVFVPGHSGLSVNHALVYGRPFATLGTIHQPPEIDFLQDEVNGLILTDNEQQNLDRIQSLLVNFAPSLYERAFEAGKQLSVSNWCSNIYQALSSP